MKGENLSLSVYELHYRKKFTNKENSPFFLRVGSSVSVAQIFSDLLNVVD